MTRSNAFSHHSAASSSLHRQQQQQRQQQFQQQQQQQQQKQQHSASKRQQQDLILHGAGVGSSKSSKLHSAQQQQQQKQKEQQQQQLTAARSVRHANALLRERDAQVAALQSEVNNMANKLAGLNGAVGARSRYLKRHHSSRSAGRTRLPAYGTVVHSQEVETDPKRGGRASAARGARTLVTHQRAHMGRNASIATARVFDALPDDHDDMLGWIPSAKAREDVRAITDRIQAMFKDPSSRSSMSYLRSAQFASDVIKLNRQACHLLEEEPRCAFLQSPCYVFGDIHGNLEDLHFFSDNIWRLGMSLTAGNFVFLGDYVDRGMSCLEVVAYLVTMKLLLPHKVFLLRGNHETRDVNGWEEHYGARSFIHQCQDRFGDDVGYRVWESTNQVFDRLPLSAVIDQDIFCVHGGIPRPVDENGGGGSDDGSRIQDILGVPKVAGINPPYEHEEERYQQVASDCIWSDPASEEQEANGTVDSGTGFGESLRGGGAICFGHMAVTEFLQQQGFSYIMRAHEAHAEGVAVSKGARVFTVFSTSKDHNQGSHAMAGCILVDSEKMQVINRSPAYRNQYVHRRDSVSLAALSEAEIDQRIRLGLVTDLEPSENDEDDDDEEDETEYNVEEWDDFEEGGGRGGGGSAEDDDSMHYVIDTRRASAVDPSSTVASPMGSTHDNHDHGYQGDAGADASASSARKHFDFASMGMAATAQKKGGGGGGGGGGHHHHPIMSPLNEGDEGDDIEEEDSTVDGEEEAMMEDSFAGAGGSGGGSGTGMGIGGSGSGSSADENRPNINFSSKHVSSRHRKVAKTRREYGRDNF